MTDRLDHRLRSALARRPLPSAPAGLHARLSAITATAPARSTQGITPFARPRLVLGLAAVLAGTVLVGLVASGGDLSTTPSPTDITAVDGLRVLTVSEAIAARDGGALDGGRVAIRGFWSGNQLAHSCPAPNDPVGDLEVNCREGEFGITERNEQMLGFERTSTGGVHVWHNEVGPYLTPWVPPGLDRSAELFPGASDDGWPPPVPIVVIGHFDDPRADACRPEAEQLCRERLVLDRIVQLDGVTLPAPSPPPTVAPPPPSDSADIDGLPVMTVSEALAAHASGGLPDGRVVMRGYWTNNPVVHGCVPFPTDPPGALEIACYDGEYGITELDEPIWLIDTRSGQVTYTARGPHLTPLLPSDLDGIDELFLPMINGQWYPPVPIVVLGHFDDPRAADCRPDALQLCRDRLVIDRIVAFDIGAVPTPGVTPSPTPFPSPAPPGLFDPEECAGDVPYSFVGWAMVDELGIDRGIEGHIWAVVSRDPVDRSGEWIDHFSGQRYRHFARVICFRAEYEDEVMNYESVPGTEEIHWEDGLITAGTEPVRPAATG